MKGFWPFLTPSGWFLGLGLFQNMFQNLLIYTNNFCFGYIAVSCFFETFPAGWLGGWVAGWVAGWLKNPILMKTQSSAQTWTWTLDFDKNSITVKYSQCWCKPLQCVYSHILRFKNMIVYMIFLHTIIAPKERNFVLVGVGVRLKRFF